MMAHFANYLDFLSSPFSTTVTAAPSCLVNIAANGQRHVEDTCLYERVNIRHHFKCNRVTEEADIFLRCEKTRMVSEEFKGSFEETFRWLINLISS